MKNNFINGSTLVGEIVNSYPEAVEVLLGSGMHCLGCPASQAESLEDSCAVHGLKAVKVVEAVNQKIAESRKQGAYAGHGVLSNHKKANAITLHQMT